MKQWFPFDAFRFLPACTVAKWVFVSGISFGKAVGQAFVKVNSVQLVPAVVVYALSKPAWGWTTERFSVLNSFTFR